ncbi:FKBP-type peptidyl-prolyl cis-trans isomerase N-terminal domain-containing protein [Thiomicrospira cyclica]|uniref:Peptidyl-prolyl cis-trans isomerase n=1 Tax=Thiomicrospira cyclica (strain DSM 14477 / JCM 11371 / ALM1) TaxID=717773 RepID=F6DBC4_THICA|nr:FKBP-type peptidyl-prolyl cis-trans isomerase [Thiomicrospira cyclica]AEG31232.1 FKBP-type peptidyl-prolyl isomerase domain protein [Thiomicrospira cyclica ALM1]
MRFKQKLLTSFILSLGITASVNASQSSPLNSTLEQASYAVGVDLANNLQMQGINLDTDAFLLGLRDSLTAQNLKLTADEMQAALTRFQEELELSRNSELQALAEQNLAKGEAFLAENAQKEGVVTLPSGVQYRIIEEGEGPNPTTEDVIIAHYRGELIDGTEFDSSYNRGVPIQFALANVIPGWQEVIQLMQPGATWQVFIPSDMAYGLQGAGNMIGPNETLIFEINFIVTAAD